MQFHDGKDACVDSDDCLIFV